MEPYFVSCKKYTANENRNVRKSKRNRLCFYQIALFMARKS